jgi:hypothetical protein
MARRVQAYVNRFFGWCIERDILAVNPMAGMERIANGKSRDCIIAAEMAKQKPGQVEPVSVGGRGKVNKLKARVVAKGKQHGVSESTVKRRLAKAAGKKPEARKPKVQIEGFLRFVGMLHGLTQASDPSDEALAGLTKDQRADAIEIIDTIMPKLGRLRDRLRLKDGLR